MDNTDSSLVDNRIVKLARGLDKALNVVWIIVAVAGAIGVCAVAFILIAANWLVSLTNGSLGGSTTLTSGTFSLELPLGTVTAADLRWFTISVLPVLILAIAVSWWFIHALRQVLVDLKEGQPFTNEMPDRIRLVGVATAVLTLAMPLVTMVPYMGLMRLLDAQRLAFATYQVGNAHISLGYSVNATAILACVAIFLLSYVFEYGAKLQKESDETL